MKRAAFGFVGLVLMAGQAAAGNQPDPVEVRFCPASSVHSYPLDTMHDASSVLLQNVAFINRSSNPVTIDAVEIALQSAGQSVEIRRLSADALAKSAKGAAAMESMGFLKLAAFQFCGTALLGTSPLSGATTLAPGAALLVASQPIAFKGQRDQLVVSAFTGGAKPAKVGEGAIKVQAGFAKTELRFPLKGAWWIANGASFHGGHRWAIPEEFALDILRFGADGKTHRGTGQKFSDYYAYGEKIYAPAGGKVVVAINDQVEDPSVMRQPTETQEAYFERLLAGQADRMAGGTKAVLGNGVVIDHGNGEYSLLAHMKPGSVKVAVGDVVAQGQEIGALGSSGNSTEPHLHYHLCDTADGLMCAGIPMTFSNIDVQLADLPRPLQTGDVVVTH